jgi:hypothetical protein
LGYYWSANYDLAVVNDTENARLTGVIGNGNACFADLVDIGEAQEFPKN